MKRNSILLIILMGLFLSTAARADNGEWFCTDASSQRSGSTYQVCGVAVAPTEEQARQDSIQAAYKEFTAICEPDATCNGYQTIMQPKRCDCAKRGNSYQCRRMIEITVTKKRRLTAKSGANELPADSSSDPVVYIGEDQQSLINAIGMPDQVIDADADGSRRTKILFYSANSICAQRSCSVVVQNGHVARYSGVSPKYSDALREPSGFWSRLENALGVR